MASKLTRLTKKNSDTTAPSGRELRHLQFSLQTASPETFGYTLVHFLCSFVNILAPMTKHRVIQAWRQAANILHLGSRRRWAASFTSRFLYFWGKNFRYVLDTKRWGPQSQSWRVGDWNDPLLARYQTRTSSSQPYPVTLLMELSWFSPKCTEGC
jgi:hypothetical protein